MDSTRASPPSMSRQRVLSQDPEKGSDYTTTQAASDKSPKTRSIGAHQLSAWYAFCIVAASASVSFMLVSQRNAIGVVSSCIYNGLAGGQDVQVMSHGVAISAHSKDQGYSSFVEEATGVGVAPMHGVFQRASTHMPQSTTHNLKHSSRASDLHDVEKVEGSHSENTEEAHRRQRESAKERREHDQQQAFELHELHKGHEQNIDFGDVKQGGIFRSDRIPNNLHKTDDAHKNNHGAMKKSERVDDFFAAGVVTDE